MQCESREEVSGHTYQCNLEEEHEGHHDFREVVILNPPPPLQKLDRIIGLLEGDKAFAGKVLEQIYVEVCAINQTLYRILCSVNSEEDAAWKKYQQSRGASTTATENVLPYPLMGDDPPSAPPAEVVIVNQSLSDITHRPSDVLRTERWRCDLCARGGVVNVEDRADVSTVINAILDDHFRISPHCRYSYAQLKVGMSESIFKAAASQEREEPNA